MSIRLRFGLACGGVFLLVGALVLAGLYLVVRQTLEPRRGLMTPEYINTQHGFFGKGSRGYEITAERAATVRRVYQSDALANVRTYGALIVLGGAAASVGVGYGAAGWGLRPLRAVTRTARRVAQGHDLTGRIGYKGSSDELEELAGIFDTMLGRLARSFDGQRRFVANASHELRTPLTINRTLVDVAVRRPEATDDVKRLGESLLLVNTRHERLIDGLLALAEGRTACWTGVPSTSPTWPSTCWTPWRPRPPSGRSPSTGCWTPRRRRGRRCWWSGWCRTWWRTRSGTTTSRARCG
ncbi:HAMP domain-containing protein [Nonomuraea recticatena]|uniref:HAMP domain-containing protein n=1 Tax=Nonomuraea recticatena TaxID=46178 RepID=UPI003621BF3B